ncbi:MAG: peptidylprolyl isomerase [Methylococcales bacterium]
MLLEEKLSSKYLVILAILFGLFLFTGCSKEKPVSVEMLDQFISEQKIDKNNPNWKLHLPRPPMADFAEHNIYFWELETNKGMISIQLMPQVAPMHVSSTIYLTRLGFYDGVVFHRVIPDFMAQGGDPTGTGGGSPGYKYDGEFDDGAKHDKPGILSMANAGPGTDGSQFFLTYRATPHLDNLHTVFGEIVAGLETLKEMEKYGSSPSGRTSEKLEILKATIRVEEKKD